MLASKLSAEILVCPSSSLSSFSDVKTGDWFDRFRFITLSVANYQNGVALTSPTADRLASDILHKVGLLGYGG